MKETLEKCKEELGVSSIEAVNGYCNLFVNRVSMVQKIINEACSLLGMECPEEM